MPDKGGQWHRHACAVRFHQNQWVFYDPDTGEYSFDKKSDFIEKLLTVLGNSLIIHIASWHKGVEKFHADLISFRNTLNKSPTVLNEFGLGCIIRYSRDQLREVITIANNNPMTQNALVLALPVQSKGRLTALNQLIYFNTNIIPQVIRIISQDRANLRLFNIALNQPSNDLFFMKLIALAKEHFLIRKALIDALSNTHQNTPLQQAMTRNHNILNGMILLADSKKDFESIFSLPLPSLSTTMNFIANTSQELLFKIFEFAKNSTIIRCALFASLPNTNCNTAFQQSIRRDPETLTKMTSLTRSFEEFTLLLTALDRREDGTPLATLTNKHGFLKHPNASNAPLLQNASNPTTQQVRR
jgi:hypothetical protein